ncbi:MAG: phasin family protein [Hyphomicrobiaceae bacterium]
MMVKPFDDMQRMNQAGVDSAMKMMGEWGKSWQAIAAEMTDYTKRSFEEGTHTLEKLMAAKTMEQALEIQQSYARRAYDDYMHQMTKLGTMYSDLAKEAYRPVERAMQAGR